MLAATERRTMEYQNVYELSKRNGPPIVDLRHAKIEDDFGDRSHAELSVSHRVPEDVSREQLDYYGSIYGYLEDSDLLFYLYPIAREYAADNSLECIDAFFYSLDRSLDAITVSLSEHDRTALIDGIRWIWESGGASYADWYQCKNLQKIIGITVKWDD